MLLLTVLLMVCPRHHGAGCAAYDVTTAIGSGGLDRFANRLDARQ
jgi:hypothetical protein